MEEHPPHDDPHLNPTPHHLPDRGMTCPSAAADASSSSSSSLDTLQTSENEPTENIIFTDWQPEEDEHQRWCHGGWQADRRRVRDALLRTHQSPDRICRYQDCGKDCWVYQHKDDKAQVKVIANHCMDRFCVTCGGLRGWKVRTALAERMKGKTLRLITLTLSGKGASLADLLDKLYRNFKALRQTELWENSVDGGCAFLEVKWNPKANRWHPHLHLITEGRFVPQDQLSNLWHALTKDSFIVDVRRIKNSENTAGYVTKYVTKPLNTSIKRIPLRLDEAIVAMKARRFVFCFGTWYGTALNEIENDELFDAAADAAVWTSIGRLSDVLQRARSGDANARNVLEAVERQHRPSDGDDADDG